MTLSRRHFLLSAGAAAIISARGFEAWAQTASGNVFSPNQSGNLILDSNENPLGPGAHVIDAVLEALDFDGAGAGRYVFAQQATTRQAIADHLGVTDKNILLGAGSTELLRLIAETFTSKEMPLVTANPSYPAAAQYAELLGHPVKYVRLADNLHIDLGAMLDGVEQAGVLYICNPNNPTGLLHSIADLRAFVDEALSRSPQVRIVIDEAYIDYVVDAEYESLVQLSTKHPQVVVARTFSKAYGMAGLRVGFLVGHTETIAALSKVRGMDMYTSYPARAAAIAAIGNDDHIDQEQARNRDVRRFTQEFLADVGLDSTQTQANFVFFDCGQQGVDFKESCSNMGVSIRSGYADYPNHVRVTLGTMQEMQHATDIFAELI